LTNLSGYDRIAKLSLKRQAKKLEKKFLTSLKSYDIIAKLSQEQQVKKLEH
jgi:hypothetical protein